MTLWHHLELFVLFKNPQNWVKTEAKNCLIFAAARREEPSLILGNSLWDIYHINNTIISPLKAPAIERH